MALGLAAKTSYLLIIVLAVLAMAPVIALVGAIGFVGLISTFIAKNIIGFVSGSYPVQTPTEENNKGLSIQN